MPLLCRHCTDGNLDREKRERSRMRPYLKETHEFLPAETREFVLIEWYPNLRELQRSAQGEAKFIGETPVQLSVRAFGAKTKAESKFFAGHWCYGALAVISGLRPRARTPQGCDLYALRGLVRLTLKQRMLN